MKTSIPKGWLGCPSNGINLIASKFMAFKTPLSKKYDTKLTPEDIFSPESLFLTAKENNVKFGLWIDLTNTDRYYSPSEIEDQGCNYIKLRCTGHGQCPSKEITRRFVSIVHEFIVEFPHECIAVHCTHGFNRTGFFIVSFLVENLGYDVQTAVKEFAAARPPGIYRQNYIQELYVRYGRQLGLPPVPRLPIWANAADGRDKRKKN